MRWPTLAVLLISFSLTGCGAPQPPAPHKSSARAPAHQAPTTSATALDVPVASTSAEPAPQAEHGHGHGHAHHRAGGRGLGPLGHRFENAEAWAPHFDDPNRHTWQRPTEVVRLLEARPGMTVADIGAGTGYFLPLLSEAVGPSGVVHALDIEPDMVRYMNERTNREKLTNVRPRLVTPADPALDAASVDRILIVNTWHHIPERRAYAAKLRQALVPGGFVAVVDYTLEAKRGPPKHERLPPERLMAELEAGGLVPALAIESLPDQYVVLGRRPKP